MLSINQEMTETFKTIMALSHKVNKPCPRCHHMTLVQPGPLDKATGRPLVAPVCAYPHCKWRENAEAYTRRHRKEATSRAKQMRYNKALGYFTHYSVQGDSDDLGRKSFNSFKAGSQFKVQKIKKEALHIAERIVDGEPVHTMFVGRTGTGKTHLAYSVVNQILRQTSYRKQIVFLNMLKLSVLQQKAISDDNTRKWFNGLLSQVGKADLVVLDDLGRERKNRWNQMIVALIAEDRTKKPLLMTSNLQEGISRYSQQTQDRLLPNRRYSINFRSIANYRPIASQQNMKNDQLLNIE